MKHVITLSLMTLHLGAMSDADESLPNAISKLQTMVANELNIPIRRVAELFVIVIKDLEHFSSVSQKVRDLVSQMRSAEA